MTCRSECPSCGAEVETMEGMTVIRHKVTQEQIDEAARIEMVRRAAQALDTAEACPGCGRTSDLEFMRCDWVLNGDRYRVRCTWCDWCGPEAENPHYAVDEWNKREAAG